MSHAVPDPDPTSGVVDYEIGVERALGAGLHRTALLLARAGLADAEPDARARLRLLEGRALTAGGTPNDALAVLDDAWLLSLEAGVELDGAARAFAYGECLLAIGDHVSAVEELHIAWRTEAARGNAVRASEAAFRCADGLIATGRHELGRRAADAARAVFVSVGRTADAARCDLVIARVHEHDGALTPARTAADRARRALRRASLPLEAAHATRYLAKLCLADAAPSDAVALLEEALLAYEADLACTDAAACRQELAEALVELGLHINDHAVIASSLPWFSAAFEGFVAGNQPRQAASSARREAWTLQMLGRSIDARQRLDETTNALRRAMG